MHVHFEHREQTSRFLNTVFNTTIDLCSFLNGTDKNNLLANFLTKQLEESLPKGFFHPCPYSGELKLLNVTIAIAPETSMFLKGIYRMTSRFFDTEDENILTAITDALLD